MSELRVDTGSLQKRSAAFQAEADEHRAVAAGDAPGVETDIAGFGEISLMLHDAYRATHALKQQAWNDHGAATDEHGNKISESAQGYDRRESDGVAALDHTEPIPPEPTIVPPSSGPAFKMHGPGIQEVVPGTGEIRPQMPPGVGPDAPNIAPSTPGSGGLGGGVSGPFDVQGSGAAQVRPAGHIEPINPSAGDYDRLYPKLFPNPLPGQPGGGTWADVAPSAGDATHPPHGGLIPNKSALPGEYTPNSRGPEFTEVWPNAQGGYDIMAPGIDPTPSTRTDGTR